jgi:hypothetical protein
VRPLLECGEESFLREVFGKADIAGEAGEGGDDAGRLDAPDGFNSSVGGAVCGVMWIGSGHCYRSHQFGYVSASAVTPLPGRLVGRGRFFCVV